MDPLGSGVKLGTTDETSGLALEEAPDPVDGRPGVAVDDSTEAGSTDADAPPETATGAPGRTVYRLRDLDRRGRLVAAVFAISLALAPVLAFIQTAPDWMATGDQAHMAVRALDVGTRRTPVTGQPSTSASYVDDARVTHPGPLHFYLMALPVRLLGVNYGMLVVSLFITGSSVLIAAWAVFRQLGPRGGMVAAIALGAITFTTGAGSLMNPVSSNIAGYPLLCSMVLLWCLLCGDIRIVPLTAVVLTFAAQQHLSSLPTIVVATGLVGLVLMVRVWRRRSDPEVRRAVIRPARWALLFGVVLWSPVILQQLLGDTPNLSAMVEFSQSNDRPTVGFERALWQMTNVLGWPPALGQQNIDGFWFLAEPSLLRWITAVAVLALALVVGLRSRHSSPRRAALAVMTVFLVLAALMNGSSVPKGMEEGRLPFYHWAWPLSFFVVMGLGLALISAVERLRVSNLRWIPAAAVSLAALLVAVPAIVNPSIDRRSNKLDAAGTRLDRQHYDELVDGILEHRDELEGQTVVIERGGTLFNGFGPGLSVALLQHGIDIKFQPGTKRATHQDRMVDRDKLQNGLVLVTADGLRPYTGHVPGELVAETSTTGFDSEAYRLVMERIESVDEVVVGEDLQSTIDALPDEAYRTMMNEIFSHFEEHASLAVGQNGIVLQLMIDHPLESPKIDPALLERLKKSVEKNDGHTGYRLQVYLLDRAEMLDYAMGFEIGRAP
jgi:hypothetical protein